MTKKINRKKSSKLLVSFPKKYLLFIFLFLIISVLFFFVGKVFLVASVNGKLITRIKVIKELEKQGGAEILDSIITRNLISQEAKKRKISVTNEEIKKEISKIEENITVQGATLDDLLAQQGMTKKDLEEQIILQLQLSKMVDNKVTVTDEEIQEYLSYSSEITEEQAKELIKEQKLQERIQTFLTDLKNNAKINYFIKY